MFADFVCASASSSSHLPPTTPPAAYQFDQVSIVDGSVSEQETILESPSDNFVHNLLVRRLAGGKGFRHSSSHSTSPPSRLRKRYSSSSTNPRSPLALSPDFVRPPKRVRMDMNMAQPGTVAATPGFQTPLATYVAQMVVWLWYGDIRPPALNQLYPHSPVLDSSTKSGENYDISQHPTSPLNPLQATPSLEFSNFVARMLQITMVSHSVTLVALLYIYRLKMRHRFEPRAGSEQRPFLAGLMLSNKYLDDNTYTNSTWSELSGVALHEVNQMERELIGGLGYELGVEISEFKHWSVLLDGFMLSRQQGLTPSRHNRQSSMGNPLLLQSVTPAPLVFPSIADNTSYRARSASPPHFVTSDTMTSSHVLPPIADHVRKHSAVEGYPESLIDPSSVYASLLPPPSVSDYITPTQQLQNNLSTVQARPAAASYSSNPSLGRSTSLNRRYGRIEADAGENGLGIYGRRGSVGHVYGPYASSNTGDPPAQEYTTIPSEWNGGRALLAPYEVPDQQPQYIPPEHLMFYKLTAAPHPGPDGAPRKGRLRFQDPTLPFSYPVQDVTFPTPTYYPIDSQPAPHVYTYDEVAALDANGSPSGFYQSYENGNGNVYVDLTPNATAPSSEYLPFDGWSSHYVDPQPGQFANAGPPGYAYNPYANGWQYPPSSGLANTAIPIDNTVPQTAVTLNQFAPPTNRWSTVSDEHLMVAGANVSAGLLSAGEAAWQQSRSEWSSPLMPTYE